MRLGEDLLAQARYLVRHEPRRPKQATLRRSISTAYYGLFHLLTDAAAHVVISGEGLKEFRPLCRTGARPRDDESGLPRLCRRRLARPFGASVATGRFR